MIYIIHDLSKKLKKLCSQHAWDSADPVESTEINATAQWLVLMCAVGENFELTHDLVELYSMYEHIIAEEKSNKVRGFI